MRTPRIVAATGALSMLLAGSYTVLSGTWSSPAVPPPPPDVHTVVVAELFTSEGCSSCPPADALLSTIVHQQPVPGVTVLGLSEHVDYWNRLSWRDPFSSAAFSGRQSEYQTAVFHSGTVYTPQIVVDGHLEEIGSDATAVKHAIAIAAQAPKAAVDITTVSTAAGVLHIRIDVDVPPQVPVSEAADLVVAITEDQLVTDVPRGENSGRRLAHDAVVRTLTPVGTLPAETRRWSTTASATLRPEWKSGDLKVVAFLQGQKTRRIIGAGSLDVAAHSGTP